MQLLIKLLLNGLAVFLTSYILKGVHLDGFITALIVAVVLAVVNATLKPILKIITFPISVLTLGLFNFVLNALLILLVDALIPGFKVDGILWALAFSLVVSFVSGILNKIVG